MKQQSLNIINIAAFLLFTISCFFCHNYYLLEITFSIFTVLNLIQIAFLSKIAAPSLVQLFFCLPVCIFLLFAANSSSHIFIKHFVIISLLFSFICSCNKIQSSLNIFYVVLFCIGIEIVLFIVGFFTNTIKFFPNNSILSILITSQLAFVSSFFTKYIHQKTNNKKHRILISVFAVTFCSIILIATKGRAGFISFLFIILILNFNYLKQKITKKVIVLCFVAIAASLVFIKSDSSSGRLLIYQVVFHSLKPSEYFTGIGYGKFKAKYNQFQADYFSTRNIDNKEALLADNTYFAFNDVFQLIVERGIIGMLIIFFFLRFLYVVYKKSSRTKLLKNPILYGSFLCMFSILFSCFFSYPFQVLSVIPLFLFSLAVIILNTYTIIEIKNAPLIITRRMLALTATVLVVSSVLMWQSYYQSEEAKSLSEAGYRKEALKKYSKQSNNLFSDESIYYFYAQELSKTNQLDSSLVYLSKSKSYFYNDKTAMLFAKLHQEKSNYLFAEKYYQQAVYINPKMFSNRFELFNFYIETNQEVKAKYWGNSILNLKPKIPSEDVDKIKKLTAELLSKIL